jgi:hypothetical protein
MKILVLSVLFLLGLSGAQAAYSSSHTHIPVVPIEGGPVRCACCDSKIIDYLFNASRMIIKPDGTVIVVPCQEPKDTNKKTRNHNKKARKSFLHSDEVLSDEE